MYCGKCGKKLVDGYEFCMNCGAKMPATNNAGTDTGGDIKKSKGDKRSFVNKKTVICFAATIIVIAVVMLITSIVRKKSVSEYFANIPWDTDMQTIQKMIKDKYDCEIRFSGDKESIIAIIDDYDGMDGVSASVFLNCGASRSLNSVYALLTVEAGGQYSSEKVMELLTKKYSRAFGEPENTYGFSNSWTTKNSIIEVLLMSDTTVVLSYDK